MATRPALRASDADRDRVATALAHHHAAGRLSVGEFDDRLGRALTAVTVADLDRLTADLPAVTAPGAPSGWAAPLGPHRPGPAPGLAYAGFWLRAGALGLDTLVSGVLVGLLDVAGVKGQPIGWVAMALFPLYFVAGWALGATPGMLPMGLRVRRAEDGGRPGLGRAIARLGGWVITTSSLGLGFAWAAWDPRRQGWHDKVADTVVVRRLPGDRRRP